MLDESIATLLPSWLVRLDAPPSSRDPLGLQGHAMAQADRLLPGLNVFTSRARYYTFLCWALARAQAETPPRAHLERVFRLERLLVLCEALQHEDEPLACGYIGRRRGRSFVSERRGAGLWELPTRILKNQVSNGALRLYRTSLASLCLVEEDDLEEGLGLRLTDRGQQLANQLDRVIDEGVVSWALDGGTQQQKRRGTLLDAGARMCLSSRMGAYERRYLVASLFGADGDGIERRETVQVLFENQLLGFASVGSDSTDNDADLITDDGGRPAEEAALFETRTNWGVLRPALALPATNRLQPIQVAGAYQLAALGLNALFASALEPAARQGRLSLAAWRERIAERAGVDFEASSAAAWAGHRSPAEVAADLLDDTPRPWPEIGMLAIELLLRLGLDERYARWLGDDPTPIVERLLVWTRDASIGRAGELAARLLPDLVEHHRDVSVKKGKGEWLVLDGQELVKHDPRPLRLLLHSLRFAQLAQLAADLNLHPKDVADET
ncbi:hypothetical protein BE20_58900 [Sorangium cellulosum]|uniref:Uncharacterized protein n=1 Tax=Sorangium cellulosum TaxID=56 RepID=A0A150SWP3_SORCE|nr:hypothetical protein BE18_20705 [Sorangium cellulosum]KYF99628.1 hypothetical protein BE20_58900 [Sorangium cellulosum]